MKKQHRKETMAILKEIFENDGDIDTKGLTMKKMRRVERVVQRAIAAKNEALKKELELRNVTIVPGVQTVQ